MADPIDLSKFVDSFALNKSDDGQTYLYVNLKSAEPLSAAQEKELDKAILSKLNEAGIYSINSPVNNKVFTTVNASKTSDETQFHHSPIFADSPNASHLQGKFILGNGKNTPDVLASVSEALQAPGALLTDKSVVTASINPTEYKNAEGNAKKLQEAAANPVQSGELAPGLTITPQPSSLPHGRLNWGKIKEMDNFLLPSETRPVYTPTVFSLDELQKSIQDILKTPEVNALSNNVAKDALVKIAESINNPLEFNKQISALNDEKNNEAVVELLIRSGASGNSGVIDAILSTAEYYGKNPLPADKKKFDALLQTNQFNLSTTPLPSPSPDEGLGSFAPISTPSKNQTLAAFKTAITSFLNDPAIQALDDKVAKEMLTKLVSIDPAKPEEFNKAIKTMTKNAEQMAKLEQDVSCYGTKEQLSQIQQILKSVEHYQTHPLPSGKAR